ncbi:hypothetical protein [Williamsia muralis]|uniref:hypothetical protein n=1 Tax=Williamsia marianensis TaxID=85044 RepID=UPI00117BE1A9|nr:hypothetical protein [Williamsia marianensis]
MVSVFLLKIETDEAIDAMRALIDLIASVAGTPHWRAAARVSLPVPTTSATGEKFNPPIVSAAADQAVETPEISSESTPN